MKQEGRNVDHHLISFDNNYVKYIVQNKRKKTL